MGAHYKEKVIDFQLEKRYGATATAKVQMNFP